MFKEDYEETEQIYLKNGSPTIDFLIRYEKNGKNNLHQVLSNFKKSNLWENGSVQLTRFADVIFKQHFD